jgi:hypothetical protein
MQPIEAFAKVASEFCSWAESEPADPVEEAARAVKLLSRLVALVHDLPGDFGNEDPRDISHEQWLVVYKRFGSLPFNYYACYADPYLAEAPCPGMGDLADDLADTWRDIKGGLCLYEGGNHAAAAWEWRESFNIHWGRHAASALYALQCWRS